MVVSMSDEQTNASPKLFRFRAKVVDGKMDEVASKMTGPYGYGVEVVAGVQHIYFAAWSFDPLPNGVVQDILNVLLKGDATLDDSWTHVLDDELRGRFSPDTSSMSEESRVKMANMTWVNFTAVEKTYTEIELLHKLVKNLETDGCMMERQDLRNEIYTLNKVRQ